MGPLFSSSKAEFYSFFRLQEGDIAKVMDTCSYCSQRIMRDVFLVVLSLDGTLETPLFEIYEIKFYNKQKQDISSSRTTHEDVSIRCRIPTKMMMTRQVLQYFAK